MINPDFIKELMAKVLEEPIKGDELSEPVTLKEYSANVRKLKRVVNRPE